MAELARVSRELTTLPLLFQANAGQPEVKGDQVVYPQGPGEYAQNVGLMLEYGANMVGGCCGPTPQYIQTMHELMKQGST